MFSFYMSQDVGSQIKRMTYLEAGIYPAERVGNRDFNIAYLARHQTGGGTGPGSWAERYYDQWFGSNLAMVSNAWNNLDVGDVQAAPPGAPLQPPTLAV
jgi:hypothetical protein